MTLPLLDTARVLAFTRCERRAVLTARDGAPPGGSLERHLAAMRRQVLHRLADAPDDLLAGTPSGAPEAEPLPPGSATAGVRRWRPRFRAETPSARLRADVDVALPGRGGVVLVVAASGTRVRPHHRTRLAWAWRVARLAREADGGRTPPVVAARVVHVDRRQGRSRWPLESRDVTPAVRLERDRLGETAEALGRALAAPAPPEAVLGRVCHRPDPCPFLERCWSHVAGPTVFDVPGLTGATRDALAHTGLLRVASIRDDDDRLSARDLAAVALVRDGGVQVDRRALRGALMELGPPAAFLDLEFETSALTPWPDAPPYEAVPFAFDVLTAQADHVTYLAPTGPDPRPALAAALAAALPARGRIVTYDLGAERALLLALAHRTPGVAPALASAAQRLWDLLPVVRRCVRHHGFGSRLALDRVADAVAPAWRAAPRAARPADLVPDGIGAQVAWRRLRGAAPGRRRPLRRALRAYVARDTAAMAAVLDWLRDQAAGPAAERGTDTRGG